jgi:peptidoglycan-associated lipoprotein
VLTDANFGVVQPVLFAYDSAAIGVAERGKVQQAADYLKANPQANVVLVGRCDWRGTAEYNLGLGDRRGRAVMDYLGTLGVPASRVQVISKGDQDAVEGASADQMQQDRRVDFGFLD